MRCRAAALSLAALVAGCLPAAAPGVPAREGPDDASVPPGYGSLRQEEVTIELRRDDVSVRLTPLAESVIRLTAPDTYQRLAGVAGRASPLEEGAVPFLVTFYTEAAGGAQVEPRDLLLDNRGRRFRPERIVALTPGWGSGRLVQRRPEQAVYVFPAEVDLEMDLAVELGEVRSRDWAGILPRLESERARVRARAGGGGPR